MINAYCLPAVFHAFCGFQTLYTWIVWSALAPGRAAGEAGLDRPGSADWQMEIRIPCEETPNAWPKPGLVSAP